MVSPGITGWAQINYRYGNTIEDTQQKLMYDLYYIKNQEKLYNFFRDGLNFNPTFITSSNYGETWERYPQDW
jgi:hypothetical protein